MKLTKRKIVGVLAANLLGAVVCLSGCRASALSPERLDAMDASENLKHWRDIQNFGVSNHASQGWSSPEEYRFAVWNRARTLRPIWTDRDALLVFSDAYETGMHRSAVLYVLGWPYEVTKSSGALGGTTELWSYGTWPYDYVWLNIGANDRVTSWESSD